MRLVAVVLLIAGLTCAAACPAPQLLQHRVLLLKRSVKAGARFLVSFHGRDADGCRKACCRRDMCDTAIHGKKMGRCYLFHCGDPSRCTYSRVKHYNTFIFNRTVVDFERQTVASSSEAEEEEAEEAEGKRDNGFTTAKPASSNKVEQNAQNSSSSSVILTTRPPLRKKVVRLPTAKPISPNNEPNAQNSSSSSVILTTKSPPRSDKEVKSDANTTDSWEMKVHNLLNMVSKTQQKNAELKKKVHNLNVAISFISIFLILCFFFIVLILVRAKNVMARMTTKSLVLPSRGDETDDLINGIYS